MEATSKVRMSRMVAIAVLLFCVASESIAVLSKLPSISPVFRIFDCLWIAAQAFICYEIIKRKRWALFAYLLMVTMELAILFSLGLHSVFTGIEFGILVIGGFAGFSLVQAAPVENN